MRSGFVLICCFWAMLLLSCKEVSFPQAQPAGVAGLKEIPESLRGTYLTRDKSTGETGDTIIIESWGYHLEDTDGKDWLGSGHISDTLVVKQYQNYYFVNFKEGDQWVLRLVRVKSPNVLELMSINLEDEKVRKEILQKLGGKFAVKETRHNDNIFYQINPTPAQLMTLVKEGYFTGIELRRR
ncbi:MAG: hypothetical protein KIT62_09615 [Cyclobacteriaceae bacterium]|nr:hypothetical protein [Cyclobacteriaceae bacterium]